MEKALIFGESALSTCHGSDCAVDPLGAVFTGALMYDVGGACEFSAGR